MTKRLAAVFAAIMMGFVSLTAQALTCTVDGVTYEYQVIGNSVAIGNDDWAPAISTSTSGALNIPSKINGRPVTWIKDGAFDGCRNLTSVTIPDGVKTLGQSTFQDCSGLRSVSMPDSVDNISYYAFMGCSSLTSVKLPKNLVYLGYQAFANCSSLRSVSIPGNVVKVGGNVFEGTQLLENAADGLVMIDGWLVAIKGSIPERISVPSGTKGIAEMSIGSNLKSLSIPSSVVYNGLEISHDSEWYQNKMASAANGAVISDGWVIGLKGTCPKSLTLPTGTKGILTYAFQDNCENLQSITIPEGVTSIGFYAFVGCKNLKSISLPNTVKVLDACMLGYGPSVSELTIPASVTFVGWGALMSHALQTLTFSGKPCAVDQSEGPYVVYENDSTIGYYTSAYAKEWKEVLDSNGKWYGLTMKQKSGGSNKQSYGIFDSTQTFNGWLNDDYGYIEGTIQIKTAKAKANRKTGVVTSKVKATVQYLDWSGNGKLKKATYSGTMEIEDECGYLEVEGRNGDLIYLEVSPAGVFGNFLAASGDDFEITAYRDLFSSKDKADKARAAEALAKWKKTLVFALDDCCAPGLDIFTVTIGAKGKAKVSGTMLEQKFSLTTQLIVGEDRCYLPMVAMKDYYEFHRLLYLEDDGTISDGGDTISENQYGTPTPLEGGDYYFFVTDVDDLAHLVGGWTYDVYTEYLPDWWNSVTITTKGTRWVCPKAGKVVLDRYGNINESKLGENPSGLKLKYKAKDGTFSGSFKAYVNKNGKPKAVTVSVSGVLIGRQGYGTATVKNAGSTMVKINHETVLSIGL